MVTSKLTPPFLITVMKLLGQGFHDIVTWQKNFRRKTKICQLWTRKDTMNNKEQGSIWTKVPATELYNYFLETDSLLFKDLITLYCPQRRQSWMASTCESLNDDLKPYPQQTRSKVCLSHSIFVCINTAWTYNATISCEWEISLIDLPKGQLTQYEDVKLTP